MTTARDQATFITNLSKVRTRTKDKRNRQGFTLAESLLAVLLLALASTGMAVGAAFAARQYTASIAASEAKILSSTLRSAISNELSNGRNFHLENGFLTDFISQNYGPSGSAGGFSEADGKILLNALPLIGEGAYVRGMTARLYPISCENGIFHVHLEILSRDGAVLHSSRFDVRPLNQTEIQRRTN